MDYSSIAQIAWYAIFIVALFAYSILDGFNIGIGIVHLFARSDIDRRTFINAVGPTWDSNSLWIVLITGILLAGFPPAFAALYTALYIPMTLLIFGYICRATSIECRSKIASAKWKNIWDRIFCISSILLSCMLGYVISNMLFGLPLNDEGLRSAPLPPIFSLRSFAPMLSLTLFFMLHGTLYLNIKTEFALQKQVRSWIYRIYIAFVLSLSLFIWTPSLIERLPSLPILCALAIPGLFGLAALPFFLAQKREAAPFFASCCTMLSPILFYVAATYPAIVFSSIQPELYSFTIFNSSSTPLALYILLGIAAIGVPTFLLYSAYTFYVFRGKVRIDTTSY